MKIEESVSTESVSAKLEVIISIDDKHNMQEVRNLWEIVFFEDSARYLDFYFQYVYSQNVVVLAKIDEILVGMLHMNPYELVGAKTYYIVGVATHPDYRGHGIMRKMMEFSIGFAKSEGINDLILLPVDERFYTSFGFKFVSKQYNTHIQSSIYQRTYNQQESEAYRRHQRADLNEKIPMVESVLTCDSFIQRMVSLKEREGGIASYKPFEPLQTESYLRQLYYEMLSEAGKIAAVDGHIILYYDEEIVEVRVVFVDSNSAIGNLVDWILSIANKREVIFHEINTPLIAQHFTYHQQNTYDVRPYMMVLSDLCCDGQMPKGTPLNTQISTPIDTSIITPVITPLLQKDNYFNEVV